MHTSREDSVAAGFVTRLVVWLCLRAQSSAERSRRIRNRTRWRCGNRTSILIHRERWRRDYRWLWFLRRRIRRRIASRRSASGASDRRLRNFGRGRRIRQRIDARGLRSFGSGAARHVVSGDRFRTRIRSPTDPGRPSTIRIQPPVLISKRIVFFTCAPERRLPPIRALMRVRS